MCRWGFGRRARVYEYITRVWDQGETSVIRREEAANNASVLLRITLQELRELNVSNNTLKSLPASVGYLSKLESLKIGANRLKRLPLEVLEMRDLEELQVGSYTGLRAG